MKLPAVTIGMLAMLSITSSPIAQTLPPGATTSGALGDNALPLTPSVPVTGKQRVLLVIGKWADGSTTDPDVQWNQVFGANKESLRSWTLASSYGRLQLDPVETANGRKMLIADFGPRPAGNCNHGDLQARGRDAAVKANLSDDYDYLFVAAKCQGGAVATVSGRTISLFGQGGSAHVWRHEYGHNLGTHHPDMYINCPLSMAGLKVPEGCAVKPTKDPGDPTGGGATHYPGITRAFAGWLAPSEYGLLTATGLYSLANLGSAGPQLYVFQSPHDKRFISIEYRKDVASPANSGVWVRYSNVRSSVKSILVNANVADTVGNPPQFKAGQTLHDAQAGLRVNVCSTGSDATLAVALGNDALPACTGVAVAALQTPGAGSTATQYPLFSGTGIPGAQVRIAQSHNPGNILATTRVDARGKWQVLSEKVLPTGRYSVSTQQVLDGRVSSWGPNISFGIEKANLTPPLIETPAINQPTGQYPILSGQALPGATVTIARAYAPHDILATTTADGYGKWAALPSKPLPEGKFGIGVRQHLADQRSSWTASHFFQVTAQLAPPVIASPRAGEQTSTHPWVSGTALPGAHIAVHKRNQPEMSLGETVVDRHGNWSVQLNGPLPVGNFTLSAVQYVKGKRSAWAPHLTFRVVEASNDRADSIYPLNATVKVQ